MRSFFFLFVIGVFCLDVLLSFFNKEMETFFFVQAEYDDEIWCITGLISPNNFFANREAIGQSFWEPRTERIAHLCRPFVQSLCCVTPSAAGAPCGTMKAWGARREPCSAREGDHPVRMEWIGLTGSWSCVRELELSWLGQLNRLHMPCSGAVVTRRWCWGRHVHERGQAWPAGARACSSCCCGEIYGCERDWRRICWSNISHLHTCNTIRWGNIKIESTIRTGCWVRTGHNSSGGANWLTVYCCVYLLEIRWCQCFWASG